ncbi:High affinity copper uptake protein [Schistosoma japonicum]|uniref:Copper transport protein n=1 Tax=Schistosoma japonicum TaxID=6182 RepID=Q5DEA9_SCHJA|nr:SJCHGC01291 protein [Schistosoma japonicum]TNN11417.1 High affinity copper uptake protein [Schistosoma japonicum]CAX71549.1 solute carrier family 31 (copper transporters), member 1 [Schistosoma japonicum]
MDHSHHSPDHSSMQSSGHSMDMKMYFNTDLHYTLLFSSWIIDTVGKAIVACFGSFIFAIIYEALESLRQNLLLRAACNNRCGRVENSYGGPSCPGCQNPSDTNSNKGYLNPVESNEEVHVSVLQNSYYEKLRSYCTRYHLIQTMLHMIHAFMGYMLMLIVMTYNVYLLLAVLFGFTLGYFLFAQNRALLIRSHNCCH